MHSCWLTNDDITDKYVFMTGGDWDWNDESISQLIMPAVQPVHCNCIKRKTEIKKNICVCIKLDKGIGIKAYEIISKCLESQH